MLEDEFYDIIKKARTGLGLDLNQVAKDSGLSTPALRELETGQRAPTRAEVHALAAALRLAGANLAAIARVHRGRGLGLAGLEAADSLAHVRARGGRASGGRERAPLGDHPRPYAGRGVLPGRRLCVRRRHAVRRLHRAGQPLHALPDPP